MKEPVQGTPYKFQNQGFKPMRALIIIVVALVVLSPVFKPAERPAGNSQKTHELSNYPFFHSCKIFDSRYDLCTLGALNYLVKVDLITRVKKIASCGYHEIKVTDGGYVTKLGAMESRLNKDGKEVSGTCRTPYKFS